jgi:hypothetical protein
MGWIVLMPGTFSKSYHKDIEMDLKDGDYELVKNLHFYKIHKSDAIVVVSDHIKYVGATTQSEIEYAEKLNIPVFHFDGYTFKICVWRKKCKSY